MSSGAAAAARLGGVPQSSTRTPPSPPSSNRIPKFRSFTLEQIGDLLERLLAEVLDLQDLALRLTNQIAQRSDIRVLERVHRANRQLEIVDRRAKQATEARAVARAVVARLADRRRRVRAEVGEVLEVRLRERRRVAHRFFRRDRAVRLDREHETIVVRALANARLGDGEVGATNRIVDRVDANEIDRQAAVDRMLIGLDVAAALVHVQVDVEIAVVLEREEVVARIDDAHAARAR